jgi:hypothetical protein
MRTIEVAPGAILSPTEVKSHGPQGWVALISGKDAKYEFKRTFMERTRDKAWVTHKLRGNGLYEYRGIGDEEAAGFFIVDGTFRRSVRVVPKPAALAMATNMNA